MCCGLTGTADETGERSPILYSTMGGGKVMMISITPPESSTYGRTAQGPTTSCGPTCSSEVPARPILSNRSFLWQSLGSDSVLRISILLDLANATELKVLSAECHIHGTDFGKRLDQPSSSTEVTQNYHSAFLFSSPNLFWSIDFLVPVV